MDVVYRCSFESGSGFGQEIVNVLHVAVDTTTADDPAAAAAIAQALRDTLVSSYVILLASYETLFRLRVSTEPDPTVPGDPSYGTVVELDATGGGGTPTQIAPQELCLLMSLRSAVLGRSFRGHLFLPPLSNAEDIDREQVDASATYYGAAIGLRNAIENLFAGGTSWDEYTGTGGPLEGQSPRLVIYSRTRRKRADTPWITNVVAAGVTRRLHWLRSRGA